MKIQWNGEAVNAESVEFTALSEPWAEYRTASGERIRVRLVVTKVWRILDEDLNATQDGVGNPNFVTQSQNVMVTYHAEPKRELN